MIYFFENSIIDVYNEVKKVPVVTYTQITENINYLKTLTQDWRNKAHQKAVSLYELLTKNSCTYKSQEFKEKFKKYTISNSHTQY